MCGVTLTKQIIPFNVCMKTFGGLERYLVSGENHTDAELSQLVTANVPLVGHAYQVLRVKQEVNLLHGNRNMLTKCASQFYINLSHAKVILEEGTSAEKDGPTR